MKLLLMSSVSLRAISVGLTTEQMVKIIITNAVFAEFKRRMVV